MTWQQLLQMAGTAFVFMGHGTSHTANVTYDQMQTQMERPWIHKRFHWYCRR